MSATNFKTENNTYRKLLGNGLTYRIPRFQRDYSWTEDEWEDLWDDILETIRKGGEQAHYMGYLVLQSRDEKLFDVIDGQQRLTTLSIIVLAVLRGLKRLVDVDNDAERNERRMTQIRQTYIGYLDPITLVARSKLSLNRNNDHYYQTYLVPLAPLPQRGFRASEHALRKAFAWFDRRVQEHCEKTGGDAGVALATLVETMSDRLFFTVITVTDELNAYKVFETLNARGVRLSATDLLKNYLFSVLHKTDEHGNEMRVLEDRWESLVGRLGAESFPDFLRVHWISRHTFVRQSELFKTIRSRLVTREAVFDLLRGMEEDLDSYLALTNPDGSHWSPALKEYAQTLRMFLVKQPFALLIAARRVFNDADFESILRTTVMISFRYNVIGALPTSEQERVYHAVAEKVSKGELTTPLRILEALRPVYPGDESFRAAFSEKIIKSTQPRNRRVVRYILCSLEKQLTGQDYDFESDRFGIEHVLPQNPQEGWAAFSDEEMDSMVYRLGNMTLLCTSENRDLGTADYDIKRPVYAASPFALTKQLAEENAHWSPGRIAARQQSMAKMATAIWRVAQLS